MPKSKRSHRRLPIRKQPVSSGQAPRQTAAQPGQPAAPSAAAPVRVSTFAPAASKAPVISTNVGREFKAISIVTGIVIVVLVAAYYMLH